MPQLSDFLGSNVANATFPQAFSTVTATDAVNQGDPLAVLADGTVTYSLVPGDVNYTLRPLVLTSDTANSVYKLVTATTGTGYPGAQLSNGNVATPTIDPVTSYPILAIWAPSGALVASVTLENAALAGGNIRMDALSGGGFAIAYQTAAGLRYGVYDNAGNVVTALATLTANVTGVLGVQSLSTGGFALLWYYSSSGYQVSTAAFNAVGVQQGTTNSIETVGAAEAFITMGYPSYGMARAGTTGGYCVAYNFSTGGSTTFSVRLAIYNSSAVLQGSLAALSASAAQTRLKVATLTDGTIAIAYYSQGTAGSSKVAKYSGAGAQLVAPTQINAGSLSALGLLATAGATFSIFYNVTGANLISRPYNSSGVYVSGETTITSVFTGISTPFADFDIKPLADGTYLAAAYGQGASSNGVAARLTAALTGLSGAVATFDNLPASYGFMQVFQTVNPVTASPTALLWYPKSTGYYGIAAFVTSIKARTFIGVASAAALAGTTVRFQIIGPANLSKSFVPSLAVNYQANAIPGQKASFIGTTAILNGIQ